MNITVDMRDVRKVEKMLGAYRPDWTTVMKRTGAAGVSWISRNFREEGALAYRGQKWKPLSEVTLQRRRSGKGKRKGTGTPKILRDTGELSQSVTFEVTNFPSPSCRLGLTSIKAPLHHKGGTTTWGTNTVTIPERRILPDAKQGGTILTRALIFTIRKDLAVAGFAGPVFGTIPPA